MDKTTSSENKERMGFFRLEQRLYAQLERIAEKEDRTVSAIVRIAIRDFLKRRKAA